MAPDVIAAEDMAPDVIAAVEPLGAAAAADDVDGAALLGLLAADPEPLLQAPRVRAAAAVMTVAATRVLAFMGVLLDRDELG